MYEDKPLASQAQQCVIYMYTNSLNPDEAPKNSASHPDPCCLTLRQHFDQFWTKLKHF